MLTEIARKHEEEESKPYPKRPLNKIDNHAQPFVVVLKSHHVVTWSHLERNPDLYAVPTGASS